MFMTRLEIGILSRNTFLFFFFFSFHFISFGLSREYCRVENKIRVRYLIIYEYNNRHETVGAKECGYGTMHRKAQKKRIDWIEDFLLADILLLLLLYGEV